MNFKKILSGPFIWIFAAVLVLLIGSSLISGSTYKEVDTSYGLQLIEDGKANQSQ
jgi:cell division protease FtsH